MNRLCPTCHGKGSIDDPKIHGSYNYSGPNGECVPQVFCQTCSGSGWVWANAEPIPPALETIEPIWIIDLNPSIFESEIKNVNSNTTTN